MPAIAFPNIDPVLIEIGPFAIRWYALAFIAGLLIGWKYIQALVAKPPSAMTAKHVDDFVVWATLGVVLGGRFGYVGFYNLEFYIANPLAMLKVWQGGMSFHGGFLGVVIAGLLFCKKHGIEPLKLGDLLACTAPIGLFFGRIANFINSELFGRVTDAPWGVIFPNGGPEPRHPSQLYEAALEGLLLFVVLNLMARNQAVRERRGFLTGAFIAGYAASRMFVELFRQPDAHISFLWAGSTMGQWLSLPMLAIGLYMMFRARSAA